MFKCVGERGRIIQDIITEKSHGIAQSVNLCEQVVGRVITELVRLAQSVGDANQTAFGIIAQKGGLVFGINDFDEAIFTVIFITGFMP